jgi:hypothetical protein
LVDVSVNVNSRALPAAGSVCQAESRELGFFLTFFRRNFAFFVLIKVGGD